MKKIILIFTFLLGIVLLNAQTNPAITNWLINTTNIKGRHYVKGNSTPIQDNILANVQKVQYSTNSVYVSTHGIPAYITGPFQDGNPSLATDQNAIFKIPLNPVKNTGNPTATTPGNIGIFINGVALFDYRDGVSWSLASNALKGGPLMGMGDNVWNRDAVVAEKVGFDCAKAHPAMGNYHHHQNPSAFNLDLKKISSVCDLYSADGLYAIDSTKHSPLIGYAYDGFPIYGAYAYNNTDGKGGITRMKSSYSLRNITFRTQYADGTNVTPGPPVNATYPIGYFREDYQYVANTSPDYLDEHNGRFCVTPEYPAGIYCYFTTVDDNWNSTYPYAVGPTFYGVKIAAKVNSISETVTTYSANTNELKVSTNSVHISANDSLIKSIDITSNIAWEAICDQSWLTLSADSGKGNATLTLTATINNLIKPRIAKVTILGNGMNSQVITITQDSAGAYLNVSTNLIALNSSSSKMNFQINSNTQWFLSKNASWITIDKTFGNDNATINLQVSENKETKSRTDTLRLIGTVGVNSSIIIVNQSGIEEILSISPTSYTMSYLDMSKQSLEVKSNSNWQLSIKDSWLSADKSNGTGDGTITLTAKENPNAFIRNTSVFVGLLSNNSQTITVIQEANSKNDVKAENKNSLNISLFPNPSSDLIAIQSNNIIDENVMIDLFDTSGKLIKKTELVQGSTITYFDTKTLYSGEYIIKFTKGSEIITKRVILNK